VLVVHDREAAASLLRSMLGRRLLAVTEARHWYQGRRDSDSRSLLHIWLHFERSSALMAHGRGEQLVLKLAEPYASYDIHEYGRTIVAPAQEPDVLASIVGQQLLNAAPLLRSALDDEAGSTGLRNGLGGSAIISLIYEGDVDDGPSDDGAMAAGALQAHRDRAGVAHGR